METPCGLSDTPRAWQIERPSRSSPTRRRSFATWRRALGRLPGACGSTMTSGSRLSCSRGCPGAGRRPSRPARRPAPPESHGHRQDELQVPRYSLGGRCPVRRSRSSAALSALVAFSSAFPLLARADEPEKPKPVRAPLPETPRTAEIKTLIDALGSNDFQKREQAQARLLKIGEDALPWLERATKDEDPE